MIRAVENFDNLLEGEWVEPEGDWPVMTADRKAYSGLAVELYDTGEIWTVAEIVDGVCEGYSVEYFKDGQVHTVDECFQNVETGLVAVWNEIGHLKEAYRFEHEVRTASLVIGSEPEDHGQVEEDGATADVAEARKYLPKAPPDIPQSIEELLVRFDGRGEALHREASLGLGLE